MRLLKTGSQTDVPELLRLIEESREAVGGTEELDRELRECTRRAYAEATTVEWERRGQLPAEDKAR